MKSKRTTCWFINQTYYEKIIELDMSRKENIDFVKKNKSKLIKVSYPRPRLA